MNILKSSVKIVFIAFLFAFFFNGYKTEAPSRSKFKHLGESEVDLTLEVETPDVDFMKDVRGDKRLKEWALYWKKCAPGFSIDSMEDIGQAPIYEEPIDFLDSTKLEQGPNKMFYFRSPGGKWLLNPYFRRMFFKKEGEAWQPYIEVPCGVALYDLKAKKARNVFNCSALEGIDDGYWKSSDRFVLLGYSSVSRQMNVECETTESCVAPTVWIYDLKSGLMNERHGPLVKRKSCELGGYLKQRLPEFFEGKK